jgi:sulfofructose kinase
MGVQKAQLPRIAALPPLGPGPIDVVGFGENSVDVLATVPHWPAPDDKVELAGLTTLPGGQVASAMVACARLGCVTRYLGVFGDDENGRRIERALGDEGIDTSGCVRAAAPNRSAIVMVDRATGTRTVLWSRPSALDWPASRPAPDIVSQARVLMVDATDLDGAVLMAQHARSAGVPVLADVDTAAPGLERLLSLVDVLVIPAGFALKFTSESSVTAAMQSIQKRLATTTVVVTLGANGAAALAGGELVESPGFVVPVADSTGAGDAFRGGFIAAWIASAGNTLGDLLTFANATAALNCRALGAQAGLPATAEVTALVTERPVRRSNGHGSSYSGGC